jgi:hypothetical protein
MPVSPAEWHDLLFPCSKRMLPTTAGALLNMPKVALGGLSLILIVTLCSALTSLGTQAKPPRHSPHTAPRSHAISISLIAREDTLPTLGIPPSPNPDLAFATVFVKLTNQRETHQIVTLQALEIRSEPEQQLEPFAFTPQTVELKPLEHAVLDIHLRKQTVFLAQDRVKAVVRYQVRPGLTLTVASEAVAIERR